MNFSFTRNSGTSQKQTKNSHVIANILFMRQEEKSTKARSHKNNGKMIPPVTHLMNIMIFQWKGNRGCFNAFQNELS